MSLEAAIQALMSGQPLALQRPVSGGSTSAEAAKPGRGKAAASVAAAEDEFVSGGGAMALVEDSQSLGGRRGQQRERRLSTGSVSLGRPAGAGLKP